MAAVTFAVIFAAAMRMFAVANPRCLVKRVQTQPIVFMCDGAEQSATNPSANEAKILMAKGSSQHFVEIPEGTSNFVILLMRQRVGTAEMLLVDSQTSDNIVKDKMELVSQSPADHLKVYAGTYEGMEVKYSEKDYYEQSTIRIEIPGPTTRMFSIYLKNNHDEDVFTLHYRYGTFTSGQQCQRYAASVGCSEYFGANTREVAASWARWMQVNYADADTAWQALAEFDDDDTVQEDVPYYRWRSMWFKYPKADDVDTWPVYKFLTHGGLEVGAKYLERGFFDKAFTKLVPVANFAHSCCTKLTNLFSSAEAAWDSVSPRGGYGIVDLCGGNAALEQHGVEPMDYLLWYLDADGIGGVEKENLQYCWQPLATPPPMISTTLDMSEPAPSPMYSPTPSEPSPSPESPSPSEGGSSLSATASSCSWTPASDCVGEFMFKGVTVTGCTKQDWHTGWCSATPTFSGQWRECSWDCVSDSRCYWKPAYDCAETFSYKGTEYNWCTTVDHRTGWCSKTSSFQALEWRHCSWVGEGCGAAPMEIDESEYTDETEQDGISGPEVLGVTPTASTCTWANKNCAASWLYEGTMYTGCTNVNHAGGYWCSLTSSYEGKWAPCGWECKSQHTCYWKPRPICVQSFTYDGSDYNWCTKANNVGNGAWCSENQVYNHKWHHCEWECPCKWEPASNCVFPFSYKGQVYNECTKVDHGRGWCSTTASFEGSWASCSWKCPEGVKTNGFTYTTPTLTTTLKNMLNCEWVKDASCVSSFTHEGKRYSGCTTAIYGTGHNWCSSEREYSPSAVHSCIQECGWKPNNCHWIPDKRCVANFEYKGFKVPSCTKIGHTTRWCSTTPQYAGDYRHCSWDCECFWKPDPACVESFTYKGQTVKYCTTQDHGKGWCSLTSDFTQGSSDWKACTQECPQDESEYNNEELITTTAGDCEWQKPSQCSFPFNYKGRTYYNCTEDDHDGGWCSQDFDYRGRWKHCSWSCDAPTGCTFMAPKVGCSASFQYKGHDYTGCTNKDHHSYWCSEDYYYSGKWLTCEPNCPSYWEPVAKCAKKFKYKGQEYTGCITKDREEGWCSTDAEYSGNYAVCNLRDQEEEYNKASPHKNHVGIIVGSSAAAAVGLGAIGYGITLAVMATNGPKAACPKSNVFTINQPDGYRHFSSSSDYLTESTLFSRSAWMAGYEKSNSSSWVMIDLTKPQSIAGIVMRGRADEPMWVTQYEVFVSTTSDNHTQFIPIGGIRNGPASWKDESINLFGSSVVARFVRIHPLAWKGGKYPAMRVAVLACQMNNGVSVINQWFSSRVNDVSFNYDGSMSGTPEMFNSTGWSPICGHYFWNNNDGATVICKGLGFALGEVWRVSGGTYPVDAIFVETCPNASVPNLGHCNGGGFTGDGTGTMGLPECAAGREIGMKVKCSGGPEGAEVQFRQSAFDEVMFRNGYDDGGSSSGLGSGSISGDSGTHFLWFLGVFSLCACCLAPCPWIYHIFSRKDRDPYDDDLMDANGGGPPGMYPPNFFPQPYDDRMALMQQSQRGSFY